MVKSLHAIWGKLGEVRMVDLDSFGGFGFAGFIGVGSVHAIEGEGVKGSENMFNAVCKIYDSL